MYQSQKIIFEYLFLKKKKKKKDFQKKKIYIYK